MPVSLLCWHTTSRLGWNKWWECIANIRLILFFHAYFVYLTLWYPSLMNRTNGATHTKLTNHIGTYLCIWKYPPPPSSITGNVLGSYAQVSFKHHELLPIWIQNISKCVLSSKSTWILNHRCHNHQCLCWTAFSCGNYYQCKTTDSGSHLIYRTQSFDVFQEFNYDMI